MSKDIHAARLSLAAFSAENILKKHPFGADSLLKTIPMNSKTLFPLDWTEMEVNLSNRKFVHTLKRPGGELIFRREKDFEMEIPISSLDYTVLKDAQEFNIQTLRATEKIHWTISEKFREIDSKYYEDVKISAKGYSDSKIPADDKITAFQNLTQSKVYLSENKCVFDIFGDEITVIEEIGDGSHFIHHVIKPFDGKEVRKLCKFLIGGKVLRKCGRKVFSAKSDLHSITEIYADKLARIEGASVAGQKFSNETRDKFISNINPLTQRAILFLTVKETIQALHSLKLNISRQVN